MAQLRIAVIGVGGIAQDRHLPVLASFPDITLAALCDTDPQRLAEAGRKFAVAGLYGNTEQLLAEQKLDAAMVAVSVPNVATVAQLFLERGIPTLLEKPPGLTAAQTAELVRTARDRKVLGMVGFNRRFRPMVQQGLAAVQAEGPVQTVVTEFHSRSIAELRSGGKFNEEILKQFTFANSIHAIDLMRYLGGGRVTAVAASARAIGQPGYLDGINALVRFDNGATGFVSSHHLCGGGERAEIWGEQVTAWMEGGGHKELTLRRRGGAVETATATGELPDWGGTRAQDRAFVDAVRSGTALRRPACDLDDAVETMLLVEAITTAIGDDGLTVRFPGGSAA